MADPTLSLTFQQLCIRVAEYLGVADYSGGAAALPADAHDLDLVKRLVNDGYRRFLGEREWTFLLVPLTLTFGTGTVSSDNSRYYLPDDFGGSLLTPFTYDANGPGVEILETSAEEIRRLQAGQGTTTGDPTVYAVRAINTAATATGQRWEAVFWPAPSGTQTVYARYRRWPTLLSDNSHRSVAGFQHDRAVLAAALAAAELDKNDTIGVRESAYGSALAASKRQDSMAAPASVGDYGDKQGKRGGIRRFEVASYNGTPLDY
jgi:hypothetical protein